MKRCPDCQIEKLESEFNKKSAAKDGLYPYCKPCDRKRSNLWHQLHPGVKTERMKQYYRDHPEKVKKFAQASKARIAADPGLLQKRSKYQVEYSKRRLTEAKRLALRVSRKVE